MTLKDELMPAAPGFPVERMVRRLVDSEQRKRRVADVVATAYPLEAGCAERLVALAMALLGDQQGDKISVSHSELASQLGMSERNVKRAVRDATTRGVLEVTQRSFGIGCNRYRFAPSWLRAARAA